MDKKIEVIFQEPVDLEGFPYPDAFLEYIGEYLVSSFDSDDSATLTMDKAEAWGRTKAEHFRVHYHNCNQTNLCTDKVRII